MTTDSPTPQQKSAAKRKRHPWHTQPACTPKRQHDDLKQIEQSHVEVTKELRWSGRAKRRA